MSAEMARALSLELRPLLPCEVEEAISALIMNCELVFDVLQPEIVLQAHC